MFILLPIVVVFVACSQEEVEPEVMKQEKKAPAVPIQVAPADQVECSPASIEFRWQTSADPDGDSVTYTLHLGTDPNFANIVHNKVTREVSESVSLERGKIYYWRVQAHDYLHKSEFSPVRTFNTEPDLPYNSIPYLPMQIQPGHKAMVEDNPVALEWNAEDPDGDELVYDLFFGADNPPQLLKADLKENVFKVHVQNGSQYYWKVVAKDPSGAKATGEIWSFTTGE